MKEIAHKKTCMNCKYYHSELSDPTNPDYHIHNWCECHGTFLSGGFNEGYDDLETGIASCYLFEFARTLIPASWFDANLKFNKSICKNNKED